MPPGAILDIEHAPFVLSDVNCQIESNLNGSFFV